MGEAGWAVFDKWSGSAPEHYNAEQNRARWNSFSLGGGKTAVGLGSLFIEAQRNPSYDPMHGEGDELAWLDVPCVPRRLDEPKGEPVPPKPAEADAPFPADLLTGNGSLIDNILEWVMDAMFMRQPELAIAPVIAAMGMVFGRSYKLEGCGSRTNLYTLGIGRTGSGKTDGAKLVQSLLVAAGLESLTENRFESRQSVFSSLYRGDGVCFLMADEFGQQLASMTDQRASGTVKEIMTSVLDLYSAAGSVYKRGAKADIDGLTDESKRLGATKVVEPCLCIYGNSTPVQFFRAAGGDAFTNGLLPRFLCFSAPRKLPYPATDRADRTPPPALVRQLESAYRAARAHCKPPLVEKGKEPLPGAENPSGAHEVPKELHARVLLEKLQREYIDKRNGADEESEDQTDNLLSRVVEIATRLALLFACSEMPSAPKVTEAHVRRGLRFAEICQKSFSKIYDEHGDQSEQSLIRKRVLKAIPKLVEFAKSAAEKQPPKTKGGEALLEWVSISKITRYGALEKADVGSVQRCLKGMVVAGWLQKSSRHTVMLDADKLAVLRGADIEVYRIVLPLSRIPVDGGYEPSTSDSDVSGCAETT